MRQLIVDNGIECLYSELNAVGYEAGIFDYSLWVSKKDAARARALLEQAEEEMSAALDAESDSGEEQG